MLLKKEHGMVAMPDYQSLERVAYRVSRHPYFPGKSEVVEEYIEDIQQRFEQGRLSSEQRIRLIAILAPTLGE